MDYLHKQLRHYATLEDLRDVKKRLRQLEKKQQSTSSQSPKIQVGELQVDQDVVRNAVSKSCTLFGAVKSALMAIFSIDYILSHSVSGKKANIQQQNIKSPYDPVAFQQLTNILQEKYPEASKADITRKCHSVQKALKRSQCSAGHHEDK